VFSSICWFVYLSAYLPTRARGVEDKDDVSNQSFANTFCKCGAHQVHLDISRCHLLSSVRTVPIIAIGLSLLYLDISYTKILHISAITTNCQMLKAFNLSGLELEMSSYSASLETELAAAPGQGLSGYNCLHDLVCLEVLSLRSSNIANIDIISCLPMLRSLDLGETHINVLHPLQGLTRLEELLLDNCTFTNLQEPESTAGRVFSTLTTLRCLNLHFCSPPLPESILAHSMDHDVYIEPKCRR
jgi:hypothetical protein